MSRTVVIKPKPVARTAVISPQKRKALEAARIAAVKLANKKAPAKRSDENAIVPANFKKVMKEAGEKPDIKPGVPGKQLLTRVREILRERSIRMVVVRDAHGRPVLNPDGTEKRVRSNNTRFDDVADAFARQMELGNFQHTKEFIDREEGKVRQDIGVLDVSKLKLYVDTPTEGPDAP